VGCGLDSTGSGQGPVAGCFECGDEPSGSCATELVSYRNINKSLNLMQIFLLLFVTYRHVENQMDCVFCTATNFICITYLNN
jgi:hypothetical protein